MRERGLLSRWWNEWRVAGIPFFLGKNHPPKKKISRFSKFCHVGMEHLKLLPLFWHLPKMPSNNGREENLEGGGEKLALNAIVEWLIQPDSDLSWPLEFLICKIMNSLLFKPAWVRVLFPAMKSTLTKGGFEADSPPRPSSWAECY